MVRVRLSVMMVVMVKDSKDFRFSSFVIKSLMVSKKS